MTARLSNLDPDAYSARQREIADDIVSRRGGVRGPFMAWLHRPELAERAQILGAYCRYDSSVPHLLSELAILVVARHWRAQAEWAIHAPIAEKAGISADDIATILSGGTPRFPDTAMQVVFEFSDTLLSTGRISDALYERSVRTLGEGVLIDLVGLIGYYGLVALTLNAFDMPVPDGMERPFKE